MDIKLEVMITEERTRVQLLDNQGIIEIINGTELSSEEPVVYLLVKEQSISEIGQVAKEDGGRLVEADRIITIRPTWEIELDYLEQLLVEEAEKNGLKLANQKSQTIRVPANAVKTVGAYLASLKIIFATFGYSLAPKFVEAPAKKKPAKAQHRWNKEVSQIEFHVDARESQATVVWQKRNEMLIKAGAKMKPKADLNKDGSVGFSAKMGEKIRLDHQAQFKNFKTTEDIILKSVNEVGLFLYFGGTNSWLELVDEQGQTIDSYTVVK